MDLQERKKNALDLANRLNTAIIFEDVHRLIALIDEMHVDSSRGAISAFTSELILSKITQWLKQPKKVGGLKVERMGAYREKLTDYYKLEYDDEHHNGMLLRNGKPASWTSLGKLYAAYKKIHPKKEEKESELIIGLKEYFEKTQKDVLDKEFAELEKYNEIGPDVNDYMASLQRGK